MRNVDEMREDIESVIVRAGDILLSYFGKNLSCKDKIGKGFVTEADLKSEKFLIEHLSKIFPEASFWAEESGINDNGSPYCWVIDPLDGTTNFAHCIPYFCISVALTYNAEPVLGFIYNPLLKEMFFASKGKGAFLNGKPIAISGITAFEKTFLAVCIPYEKSSAYYKRFVESIIDIMKGAFAFRHCGAAALDLAYVAAGRFDAIFFEDMFWWDFAAGTLLINEAGGVTTDFANNPILPNSRTFIGANTEIHAKLREIFEKFKVGN